MTDHQLPDLIAQAASDKKARDIVVLDMKGLSSVTDYFIICSANSVPQAQAIADNIEEKLAEAKIRLWRKEGCRDSRWILLDYGIAVAHIFLDDDRNFYSLERLWGDAKARRYEG